MPKTRRAWKRRESLVADYIGGVRIPVSNRTRGRQIKHLPDIEHDWLSPEIKAWKTLPKRVTEALEQAEKASKYVGNKLPVAILAADHQNTENALVVLRLHDFWAFFRR